MTTAPLDDLVKELRQGMTKAIDSFKRDLSSLRTGRASPALLDGIMVSAYGAFTPLPQLANVNVPEARLITLQVWDKSLVQAIEKAIRESNLGLNPVVDGLLIRLPIPALTEERRKELVKIAKGYAEDSRVSLRNFRRECLEKLKKMVKETPFSEDVQKQHEIIIQKITDEFIAMVDTLLKTKENEMLQV